MPHIRDITLAVSLFCITTVCAAAQRAGSPSIVVHETEEDFEWVRSSLREAITERGMIISGELHLSDMLERTAADLGFEQPVYTRAESIEFCSALMSHRMAASDPRNLVVCPFTVSVYSTVSAPDRVYVAFNPPSLLGNADDVEIAIFEMLDGIARQAIE